jgi:hypothetical protein
MPLFDRGDAAVFHHHGGHQMRHIFFPKMIHHMIEDQ